MAGFYLFHTDRSLRCTWVYQPLPGLSAGEMLGREIAALLPADAGLQALLQQALASEQTQQREIPLLLGEKSYWYDACAGPLLDEQGHMVGLAVRAVDVTDSKQTQAALQASEEKYRLLFEATQDAIFIGDANGVYLDVNPAAAEMLGMSRQQLIGAHYSSVIPPEWLPFSHEVSKAIRASGRWAGEFPMRRADGSLVWAEYRSVFDGRHVLGVARDVTARRQSEENLRAANTRLRDTLESMTDAFYTVDYEWRFTYLNPNAERYFGRPQAEMLGQVLWRLYPEGVGTIFDVQYHKAMDERIAVHFEARAPTTGRWLEAHAYPVDEGLAVYFRDVSERKQAEEHLQILYQLGETVNRATTAEEVYEAALATLQRALAVDRASILVIDADGELRFKAWRGLSTTYRRQMERYLPWPVDEPNLHPVLIPNVAEAELGELRHAILAEGIRAIAYIPLVTQDRLVGRFKLSYNQPHAFTDAEVQLAQTVARHIAYAIQRQQAEEMLRQLNTNLEQRVRERTAELVQSNQKLGQFAAMASHDLKAPLRAIGHLASWLGEEVDRLLPPHARAHLSQLQSRVQLMQGLVDGLLDYARAGHQRHPLEKVQIAALVRRVVELLDTPEGFAIQTLEPAPTLAVERIPLEIVLRNLIGNAIRHHHRPQEGRVDVSVQVQGGFAEFVVADNGPGIDPAFHERIFELFEALQPHNKGGSGMGLAVVKQIVEAAGGCVRVESRPGHGAVFYFTWPVAEVV